jgi:hypothetical protein
MSRRSVALFRRSLIRPKKLVILHLRGEKKIALSPVGGLLKCQKGEKENTARPDRILYKNRRISLILFCLISSVI